MLASAVVSAWTLFFAALGLAIFLEGLPYFISPPAVRRYLETLGRLSDRSLRVLGLTLMAGGLVLVYLSLHR